MQINAEELTFRMHEALSKLKNNRKTQMIQLKMDEDLNRHFSKEEIETAVHLYKTKCATSLNIRMMQV